MSFVRHSYAFTLYLTRVFSLLSRVKPAIFDLLLAVCIAAYLGMMYLAIQVKPVFMQLMDVHHIPELCQFYVFKLAMTNI